MIIRSPLAGGRTRPPAARPVGALVTVELASKMGVSVQRVNTLINGKRGVTAETAILLAKVLETTPQFWMSLQADIGPLGRTPQATASSAKVHPARARLC